MQEIKGFGCITILKDTSTIWCETCSVCLSFALIVSYYSYPFQQAVSDDSMTKLKHFEDKFLTSQNVIPYRTEWKIVGEDEGVGGTVDFVGKKSDGTFMLIDWKTTANLGTKFTNNFDHMAK